MYVGQAAMTAAPVYGVNAYANNSGVGYYGNSAPLLI